MKAEEVEKLCVRAAKSYFSYYFAAVYLCSKPGDLDGDCRVNFSDFAVLAAEWDGDIDMAELAEFVSRWLQ